MKACVLTLIMVCAAAPLPVNADQTRVIMRDVYDAIAYLLPLSLRDPDVKSVWDRELVDAKLDILSGAASALKAHAQSQDAEFRLLARSFDRLARDTAVSFREEWPDYAYYSLMQLTDHCVACHARLAGPSQPMFGQRLMARMDTSSLTDAAKASLYIATRQFDAALDVLEKTMLDPSTDPIEAEYEGLIIRYLRIAVAADNGIARLQKFFDTYLKRTDLPYYLRYRLQHWQETIGKNSDSLKSPPDIERAHALFDAATKSSLAPGNRIRAVEDLLAARIMRSYILGHPEIEADELSRIYFRLAAITLRTNEPDPSVPEMEMLLVAAIEAAPNGPYARRAYAMLEEYGYVHEEHLAKQMESRLLIDMAGLRAAIGIAPSP